MIKKTFIKVCSIALSAVALLAACEKQPAVVDVVIE